MLSVRGEKDFLEKRLKIDAITIADL